MSVILALTAALVLIIGSMFLNKRNRPEASPVLVRRYVHPGHTWARVTEDGDVVVGLDEFAQSVIGTVDNIDLPRLLHKVTQGAIALHVKHNDRRVTLVSPVSGRVIEKNEMVLNNPALINSSPYGDGWLFKVRPRKVHFQLNNLFTGRAASQWQDIERAELARLFSGTPALMFQEGGVLMQNLADHCSDDEWSAVARQFFLVDSE